MTTTSPVATTPNAAAPNAASSGTASSDTAEAADGSDYTMFLRMLTTQLQNQDPLNPVQSTDFAVQLATFSSVEQQTRTNELLSGLSGQVGAMGLSQLAGWVGMEARVAAPAEFIGAPITLTPQAQDKADRTVLVVTDASGAEVTRQEIAATGSNVEWSGLDANGEALPEGRYTFTLENYANGDLIGTDTVPAYSRVVEAQAGRAGPILLLDSGATVDAAAVTALRPPG